MTEAVLPDPCMVVMVGPSGSGKTTWADRVAGAARVVSSDRLRALLGEHERDMAATKAALDLLDRIVAERAARRLTTVVDTLGFDAARRDALRAQAARHRLPFICVVMDTPPETCRARNRERADPVPSAALAAQFKTFRSVRRQLETEGFDDIIIAGAGDRLVPARIAAARSVPTTRTASMEFGLQVPSFSWPGGPAEIGERLRAIALAAEGAGFSSLWVMDHFRQIPMFGPTWADMLESYTTLAHLAAVTTTIRLGTLVTGITHRNVGLLAKTIATLDVLSGGRANCGIGAAWFAEEHRAYGYRFPSRRERLDLLEDALQALPLLWGKGNPPFTGKVIELPDTTCYPRPLQDHLPILVGGSGELRTLRLAANHADACNVIGEVDVVVHKRDVLRRHCIDAGRDPDEVEVTQLSTTLVGRDAGDVERLVEAYRPRRVGAAAFAARVNAATTADHVGRYRALASAGVGTAVVSLPDVTEPDALERFGDVIAAFR